MKVLLLGAGYATRLYPLTRDKPKPLLPVGGIPILERILDNVLGIPAVDHVYIVTNRKFADHYRAWVDHLQAERPPRVPVEVIDDGTLTAETRLGAVGDMKYVMSAAKIKDDLLVIAGDNLLGFDLREFAAFFTKHGSCVCLKDIAGSDLISRYSVVTLDAAGKIVEFEEKPPAPKTSLISIGVYLFHRKIHRLLDKYLREGGNPDAPGYYIQWLHRQTDLHGFVTTGDWFDIGDIDSYNEANEMYERMEKKKPAPKKRPTTARKK